MLVYCIGIDAFDRGVGEDSWGSLGLQGDPTVHPKGDQSWVFIGRTDAEAESSVLWPPDAKSWLIWKDPDAGKDWGKEQKGMMEDEMVGWHHWHDGRGFVWILGVGDGQGCFGSLGHKASAQLSDWNELNWFSMTWCEWLPWSSFFEFWDLSQLFHSPLSFSQEAL